MTDPEQVIEANLKFYFALESQDLDLMDEVWATDGSAVCVHPTRSRITGWDNVRTSWERIFKNNRFMRVDVSEVTVEVQSSVAWVTCLEKITTVVNDKPTSARTCATNIFVFEDDRWLLVVHHASVLGSVEDPE